MYSVVLLSLLTTHLSLPYLILINLLVTHPPRFPSNSPDLPHLVPCLIYPVHILNLPNLPNYHVTFPRLQSLAVTTYFVVFLSSLTIVIPLLLTSYLLLSPLVIQTTLFCPRRPSNTSLLVYPKPPVDSPTQ